MSRDKERILYRIKNNATGLYSNCQDPVSFNSLGKIWFSVSSLKTYLENLGGTHISDIYDNCSIELCCLKPYIFGSDSSSVDFKDILDA